MKKLLFSMIFTLFSTLVFAEFQLDTKFGWFFNNDTYESDISRTFNGLDLNITPRYFFTPNIGLFLGFNCNAWFSADNSKYVKRFNSAGMKAELDEDIGYKLDFIFGIAIAFPINEKFSVQSDIGLSNTILGFETITGTIKWSTYYYDYEASTSIFIDKISSMGFYADLFGSYEFISSSTGKGCFIFGIKLDYKFTRTEIGKVVIGGIKSNFNDNPDFSGISIAPFIGYLYKR
jgi:hypothetical protein